MWPSKPEGMAVVVERQMRAQANLGIGIIGHGWAEGGWLGVLGYAAFFGFLAGAVDGLIKQRAWNPYFISAIGSCLGQLVAIPRGETSLFFLLVIAGFIGAALNAWIAQEETPEADHFDATDDMPHALVAQDAW
jgi:hypothetical protein